MSVERDASRAGDVPCQEAREASAAVPETIGGRLAEVVVARLGLAVWGAVH
jgi:hypothetical protein